MFAVKYPVVLLTILLLNCIARAGEPLRIEMPLPNVTFYSHTGETQLGELIVSGDVKNNGSKLIISNVQVAAKIPEGIVFSASARKSLLTLFTEVVAFSTSHGILKMQLKDKIRADDLKKTELSFKQSQLQTPATPIRFAERGVPCHIIETHLYANAANEVESVQVEVTSRGAKSTRRLENLVPQFESLNPWLVIDWMQSQQDIKMMAFLARPAFDDETVWRAMMRQDAERILGKVTLAAPRQLTPEEKKAKEDQELKGCMGCGCFLATAGAAAMTTAGWVLYHLIW